MPHDPRSTRLEDMVADLASRVARLEEGLAQLEKQLGRAEMFLERRIEERVSGAVAKLEERYSLIRAAVLALFGILGFAFVQYLIAGREAKPPGWMAPAPYHSTDEFKEQPPPQGGKRR